MDFPSVVVSVSSLSFDVVVVMIVVVVFEVGRFVEMFSCILIFLVDVCSVHKEDNMTLYQSQNVWRQENAVPDNICKSSFKFTLAAYISINDNSR